MTGPLTAGDKLAPSGRGSRGKPKARDSKPDRSAIDKAGGPADGKVSKRRIGLLGRTVRGFMGAVLGIVLLTGVAGGVGAYIAYNHFSADLPDVEGLKNYQPPVMSRIYAGDSRLLAELAAERRIFVPVTAIPDIVKRAFVSAEDQNFFTHRGIDPLAIARAALFDLSHAGQGRRPIGASTITQQVAKNMLLDNQMSLSRKAKEAILALRIEQNLSKDRILELYLNEIYLGLGAYGVASAAQTYFNKPLDKLGLAEAAFLAALPKAPNNLNPFKYPDAARARRDYVLDRLADDHVIAPAQVLEAKAEPVIPSEFRRPPPLPGADWFTEEVRRQLVARFGPDTTTQGGLMVRTSLDPALQLAAEKSLRDGLMAYDRKMGGWRGAITHVNLPAADFETAWPAVVNGQQRVPGMLPSWKFAIVAGVKDSEAKLEWLNQAGERRAGVLALLDAAWSRPMREGKPGPVLKRMTDIVQVGDVVMIEPPSGQPASSQPASGQPVSGQTVGGPAPVSPVLVKGKAPPSVTPPATSRPQLRQVPLVQGALVSLDPQTGRVSAMVGGWSFEQSQFNRATQANRQPGSSFKPMVYLTALQKGISPSQRFLDAPIVIDTPEGRWRPGNYEGTFGGPTSLRVALEESMNLVTLRVAQQVGMQAIADNAIAFHLVDSMPRVLPAALGAVETTVLRTAGAYASIASGGRAVTPTLIDSVQDPDGHVVMRAAGLDCDDCLDPSKPPTVSDTRPQIADPESVFQLITMMQGVVKRGTGTEAGAGLNRPIAGKTGTSQDFVDAWFAGFTPDLVTVVWVGFDTPTSLGDNETGGHVAAPIWRDYMAAALAGRPVLSFPVPQGVTMASWDTGSGTVTDGFKPDQIPGASAPIGVGLASGMPADGTASAPPMVHGGVDNSMGGLY